MDRAATAMMRMTATAAMKFLVSYLIHCVTCLGL